MFSGTVASFLLSSYNDLFPDDSENTLTILAQISRQLDALSKNRVYPISPTFDSFTFSPSPSTVIINVLWAISLAISLISALLATLLLQWTRRYNQVSRRPHSARTQALIRAYFANGTKEHYMSFTVALLPILVHSTVTLFFIGLTIFLSSANRTVSYWLIATLVPFNVAYLIFTFSSFRSHNSPYQTPNTLPFWMFSKAVKLSLAWLFGGWRMNLHKYKANLYDGMDATLETSAEATFKDNEQHSLLWTLQSLRQDEQLEEFVDAVPSVLLRDDKINFEMTNVLGPPLKNAVERLLGTCKGDILPEGSRKQRLIACYRTIWCLEDLSLRHTMNLLDKWRSSRRDSVKGEWDVLCFEAWKAAQRAATIKVDGRLALLAECSQALLAMMWAMGRYSTTQDEFDEARHILQDQLQYPPPVPERLLLIPPPSNLTVAITIYFLGRALPVLSGSTTAADNAPFHIRHIFSQVAESFGEKALGIPEGNAYRNMVYSGFGEWRSQFITLVSSFRFSDNRKSTFPYSTFKDIHGLYHDFSGIINNNVAGPHSNLTNVSHPLSFPFRCLRAVGVWCIVKLVRTMLVDIETPGGGGELSKLSDTLHACWKLADIMQRYRLESRKVIFRSYCIRAMLTVEWCKAARHTSLPLGSRPLSAHTTAVMTLHAEVSGIYINNTEQEMKLNPNFPLVVANQLLADLINLQCIAELRDRTVADDFETTLCHLLGRYLTPTDPQLDQTLENEESTEETLPTGPDRDNLNDALRRVRNFAERQGLAGTTSFINKLGI